MRFASLGSGSRGNATLIEDGETCLLVDLGFGIRETERRLQHLGKNPADINALLVTHEHSDHIQGVGAFARKYELPVYVTPGTGRHVSLERIPVLSGINLHKTFRIQSITIEPVAVPHDAREPCQFVFSANNKRLGLLTDVGHITPHVRDCYGECDGLILEANHDVTLLEEGSYPWPLKKRVGGQHGHLSNEQAAGLLEAVDLDRLQYLVLSHLSEQNNRPELAIEAVETVLGSRNVEVCLSEQADVLDWIDLSSC